MNSPQQPGYYWAKLKTPSGGNFYSEGLPPEMQGVRIEPEGKGWCSDEWEIVQVSENVLGGYDPNDDESLSVQVFGIPVTQWIGDFFWGPRVIEKAPA